MVTSNLQVWTVQNITTCTRWHHNRPHILETELTKIALHELSVFQLQRRNE